MKIIAVANQKGGVAKTTTTNALASTLARRGYNVLAVDMDPQGNLSDSMGADNKESTIYEVLKKEININKVVQKVQENLSIVPANILLATAEMELNGLDKAHHLKNRLEELNSVYDYIVIDTAPSLGVLTLNAMMTATSVLIPSTAGIFAATGINQLNDTIDMVKKYGNPELKIDGILMTKYSTRTNIAKDVKDIIEQLAKKINTKVYTTFIRESVAVEEAQIQGLDLFSYNKQNNTSKDYEMFVMEYLGEDTKTL